MSGYDITNQTDWETAAAQFTSGNKLEAADGTLNITGSFTFSATPSIIYIGDGGVVDGNYNQIRMRAGADVEPLFSMVGNSSSYIQNLRVDGNGNSNGSHGPFLYSSTSYGNIDRCSVHNMLLDGSTGGFGTRVKNVTFTKCSVDVTDNASQTNGGFLYQILSPDTAKFYDCTATITPLRKWGGGIVGEYQSGTLTIEQCITICDKSSGTYSGGFIGKAVWSGTINITRSYHKGNGGGSSGGFVGEIDMAHGSSTMTINITDCYTVLDGDVNIGGAGVFYRTNGTGSSTMNVNLTDVIIHGVSSVAGKSIYATRSDNMNPTLNLTVEEVYVYSHASNVRYPSSSSLDPDLIDTNGGGWGLLTDVDENLDNLSSSTWTVGA